MDFLTDIQKAMIQRICEAIAPPDNADSGKFIAEAESLSEFFYGNSDHVADILAYMRKLGYISE